MASQLPSLPPTDRDFNVFEAVVVASRPTREVAREFSVSQTRVVQIVERVWQWHREVMPQIEAEMPDEVSQRAARMIAADRLDQVYALAMRAFEHSKRDLVKKRVSEFGHETSTTTGHSGDVRYLLAAARIATAAIKAELPCGLMIDSQARAADVLDAREGMASEESSDAAATHRPVGDCSDFAPNAAKAPPTAAAESGASDLAKPGSRRLDRRRQRAREAFFAPVQAECAPSAALPTRGVVAQLTLSPNVPGAKLETTSH
jgi:hypothetical protein